MKNIEEESLGRYECSCNKCCKVCAFLVSKRYMLCESCNYQYDVYNHEDDMPTLGFKCLEEEKINDED